MDEAPAIFLAETLARALERDGESETMKDDGGPASDKTMRQYYKAAALQGELASQSPETGEWNTKLAPHLAEVCAAYADAMIAEDRTRAEEDDD